MPKSKQTLIKELEREAKLMLDDIIKLSVIGKPLDDFVKSLVGQLDSSTLAMSATEKYQFLSKIQNEFIASYRDRKQNNSRLESDIKKSFEPYLNRLVPKMEKELKALSNPMHSEGFKDLYEDIDFTKQALGKKVNQVMSSKDAIAERQFISYQNSKLVFQGFESEVLDQASQQLLVKQMVNLYKDPKAVEEKHKINYAKQALAMAEKYCPKHIDQVFEAVRKCIYESYKTLILDLSETGKLNKSGFKPTDYIKYAVLAGNKPAIEDFVLAHAGYSLLSINAAFTEVTKQLGSKPSIEQVEALHALAKGIMDGNFINNQNKTEKQCKQEAMKYVNQARLLDDVVDQANRMGKSLAMLEKKIDDYNKYSAQLLKEGDKGLAPAKKEALKNKVRDLGNDIANIAGSSVEKEIADFVHKSREALSKMNSLAKDMRQQGAKISTMKTRKAARALAEADLVPGLSQVQDANKPKQKTAKVTKPKKIEVEKRDKSSIANRISRGAGIIFGRY